MYFLLKAAARTLILPPSGPLILAFVGALMIWRGRRLGRALIALGLGSLWLLCTPVVADGLWRLVEHYPALDLSKPTNAQAVVILGGGGQRMMAPEYGGPASESAALERLGYGAFVARRTSLPILITGAPKETIAMRASLERDFGARPEWVENQSFDTFENAHFTAKILLPQGIKRIILVTSSTHLWRASHEFEAVGFDVVPGPAAMLAPRELGPMRYIPNPSALQRSNAALYELIGEPARKVQAALGIREKLDTRAAGAPGR